MKWLDRVRMGMTWVKSYNAAAEGRHGDAIKLLIDKDWPLSVKLEVQSFLVFCYYHVEAYGNASNLATDCLATLDDFASIYNDDEIKYVQSFLLEYRYWSMKKGELNGAEEYIPGIPFDPSKVQSAFFRNMPMEWHPDYQHKMNKD